MTQKNKDKIDVLVIGQTPPPYHGQALIIQQLVEGDFPHLRIHHVRMAYSKSLEDVGKFSVQKIFHLLSVIGRAVWKIWRNNIAVVHYPPAGGELIPILRDIVALSVIRTFAPRTLFVFHASGLYEWLQSTNGMMRWLAYRAYSRPNAAIQVSAHVSPIGELLQADRVFIIPFGIPDCCTPVLNRSIPKRNKNPRILYVGMLHEEKGISVLVEAARMLRSSGYDFTVDFIGNFTSATYQGKLQQRVSEYRLTDTVLFHGEKTGNDKWECYANADIFCFPTFYQKETFGLVIIEAMMFSLPVVATKWRGTQDAVVDGVTGYLISPKDPGALATKFVLLIEDPALRLRMGQAARERYLQEFGIDKWYQRMEEAFLAVAEDH